MSTATQPLYKIPIAQRPKHGSWFNAIAFPLLFNVGLICINLTQVIFWPMSLFPPLREPYNALLRRTKTSFCQLLILMSVLFGPTTLVLSAGDGVDLQSLVRRDMQGKVVGLDLDKRAVVMGNHQAYSDWMYVWILAYFADASDGIFILLKKSLKWVPIVGWGMQFFDFIFLSRRWKDDQQPLTLHLNRIVQAALRGTQGLWVMIFPEGTIVSEEERARSLAYAEKQGITDTTNVLLPHSLGLYTILSHLSPLPNLPLIDLTIGYPGVPPAGQAQQYYNLITIWLKGVPPPEVHIHVRSYDPSTLGVTPFNAGLANAVEADSAEEKRSKAAFGEWVLERWREKDRLMGTFYNTGRFVGEGQSERVDVGFKSGRWEAGQAMCWGLPIVLGYVGWKVLEELL